MDGAVVVAPHRVREWLGSVGCRDAGEEVFAITAVQESCTDCVSRRNILRSFG